MAGRAHGHVFGCATAALLAVAFLSCAAESPEPPLGPGEFRALVVRVSDGDTVVVLRGAELMKVRLAGIDAPERGQDFGKRAKEHVIERAIGRHAVLHSGERDRYGRLVSDLRLGTGSLAEDVVAAGLAWHYTRYSDDARLAELETSARAERRGLWRDPRPQAPWDWRRAQRSAPDRNAAPRVEHSASGAYHGNARSKVYHAPGCVHYDCKNCTVALETASEAEAQGYRAHGDCVGN